MLTVLVTGSTLGMDGKFTRRHEEKKTEELRKLAGQNGNVHVPALDITGDESIQHLADALDSKPIGVLILNSGIYPREGQKIGQIDYQGW